MDPQELSRAKLLKFVNFENVKQFESDYWKRVRCLFVFNKFCKLFKLFSLEIGTSKVVSKLN